METIAHGITELIGSTPMLEPVRFTRACGLQAQLFVKLEGFNPAGSAKDRIARAMIEEAEKNGQLLVCRLSEEQRIKEFAAGK